MKLEILKDFKITVEHWYDTSVSVWDTNNGFADWMVGDVVELLRHPKAPPGVNVSMPAEVLSWWSVLDINQILYIKTVYCLIPIAHDYYLDLLTNGIAKKLKTPKQFIPFYQDQETKDLDFIDKPKYDGICPHCGGQAFVLVFNLECPNGCM